MTAPKEPDPAADLEAEVDQAIALCDGDARAALRSLLVLARHVEEEARRLNAAVSPGYLRGDVNRPVLGVARKAAGHRDKS